MSNIKLYPHQFEDEVFKDINFNNNYMISNYGNLYSKKSKRLLKLQKHNGKVPYNIITIITKGVKQKHYLIHRLVAIHFIKNHDNLPQVNHIDGDYSNNYYMNLEWCTNRYNTIHAYNLNLNSDTYITKVYKKDKFIGEFRSLRNACKSVNVDYKRVHNQININNNNEVDGYYFDVTKVGDVNNV